MAYIPPEYVWIVAVGFIVSFVLACGLGANDVANTFGTSVGSKVLTIKQACIIATVVETAGAVLLGAKVSETIRKGIIEIEPYENSTQTLMIGNVASLTGAGIWLIVATAFKMPVSGTHSIVGATVGWALVANGSRGINWTQFGLIIASWFISPCLSGAVSVALFMLCKFQILQKIDPLEPGLRWLPVFYAVTVTVNIFSIFYDGPKMIRFDRIPVWGVLLMSFGAGLIVAVFVRVFLIPYQRKKIKYQVKEMRKEEREEELKEALDRQEKALLSETADEKPKNGLLNDAFLNSKNALPNPNEALSTGIESAPPGGDNAVAAIVDVKGTPANDENTEEDKKKNDEMAKLSKDDVRKQLEDKPEQAKIFSYLQILTSIFGGFAHGGNDVSNAIGPLISIWIVATTGSVLGDSQTPMWLLLFGGAGISIGLWIWGRRVIQTLGEDLAKITPSTGFVIEIGAAITVLVASNVGIPVSSTHCKIGSIVFVGQAKAKGNVDWSLFRNIAFAWLLTLPISGGLSAALFAALRLTIREPGCTNCTFINETMNESYYGQELAAFQYQPTQLF